MFAKPLNKTHENVWLVMTWLPLFIRPKWKKNSRVSRDCITSTFSNAFSSRLGLYKILFSHLTCPFKINNFKPIHCKQS